MKSNTRSKRRPAQKRPVETLAVPVDVRLLSQLETFLGKLADPRHDERLSFASVPRFHRALERLLIAHHEELQQQGLRLVLERNALEQRVFLLEDKLFDATAARKGPVAAEPTEQARALEVVR